MNPVSPTPGYEVRDASIRAVGLTALAMVIGVLGSLALAREILRLQPPAPALGGEGSFRHGTEARSDIARAWAEQDATVCDHLERYAWVDRTAGIVRIPIDRAIDRMLADEQERKARP